MKTNEKRTYKISFEVETEKEREMIEAYIRWSLKMIKIERIMVEEEKKEESKK